MFIDIDRDSRISIKKQLYNGITSMILNATLAAGDKLPSTRLLASELSIARNSVIEIYEQLVSESYATSIQGKGTFIADLSSLAVYSNKKVSKQNIKGVIKDKSLINIYPGTPDLEHFPKRLWINYLRDYLYRPDKKLVGYTNEKGYKPLRAALVSYLSKHKGIDCNMNQIYITNGTSGALNQIANSLKRDISNLQTESMVMEFVPEIFKNYDYSVMPIDVDDNGLIVDKLKNSDEPTLIYTSPSHQMPLGGVLPINRRRELIEYAIKGNHYIIEDDYDSEFRYIGAPVNALKQIDEDRVIYLGTFSKTLGPGIRIGFMVVPDSLIDLFDEYYSSTYLHVQTMDQYALFRLIDEGEYEKHIYKMTKLYKKKREKLLECIHYYLGDTVEVMGSAAGLHLALRYKERLFNKDDQELLLRKGLELDFDIDYLIKDSKTETDTIIIGFGHLSINEIDKSIKILNDI